MMQPICTQRFLLAMFACLLLALPASAQDPLLTNGGLLQITEGTDMVVQGTVQNNGVINNEGNFLFDGDWLNAGTYNGINGTIILNGDGDQLVDNNDQDIATLIVDGPGIKTLDNNTIIDSLLHLRMGILVIPGDKQLVLSNSAEVQGGFDDAYVDGVMYHQGTGFKFFPIGKDGLFTPVWFEEVFGINPTIGLEVFEPNPGNPQPGFNLLGISNARYWQLSVLNGTFDSSIVSIDLLDEDTTTIDRVNTLNVRTLALAIAQGDTVDGTYTSLGNASIADNIITSEIGFTKRFLAIALAPTVPEDGILFIPNIFSPSDFDPNNQSFRVFGEKVSTDAFQFRVFDKWGQVVYETESFVEANTVGWTGDVNGNGQMAPVGVYTYTVVGSFNNGNPINEVGTVTLIR